MVLFDLDSRLLEQEGSYFKSVMCNYILLHIIPLSHKDWTGICAHSPLHDNNVGWDRARPMSLSFCAPSRIKEVNPKSKKRIEALRNISPHYLR